MTKAAVVKFQNKYASEVLTPYGLTAGTGFFGSSSRAKANALIASGTTGTGTTGTGTTGTGTTTATGAYTVSAAANQPSGTLASGSAYNTMLRFNVTAGATAQTITSVTVTRTGLSIDSNVDGVLIADETGTRYGNIITFANNVATISFPSTPITVAAGTTKTLLVQFNLVTGGLSGTIGANVTAMSGTPAGLPLIGNTMSLANGSATLGALTADIVNLSTGTVTKDIGSTNYELTKFAFRAGPNEDVNLKKVTLFQNGTVSDGDLTNIKLVSPEGTVLSTVASATNKMVTFDLSANPYKIAKGVLKNLSVMVDVANGSQRTAQFIIQNNYDVVATGVNTGMSILPTAAGSLDSSFPIGDVLTGETSLAYNHMTIGAGSLTASKDSTTASGTIGVGASNTTIATYKFEAKGEDIELRQAQIKILLTTANADRYDSLAGTIRLVTEDGQQIMSASPTLLNLVEGSTAGSAPSGVVISFSPYYVIPAGTTKKISVVVDTSSLMKSTDQIQANISDIYYKKVLTNAYGTYAQSSAWITGNTLSASQGTLTVVKNGSLGNSTKVEGQSEVKIGSYLLQTNATEGVNVSSIGIKLRTVTDPTAPNTGDSTLAGHISNLKVKKSDGTLLGNSVTSVTVGSTNASPVAFGVANTVSVSGQLNISANTTQQIDVYADIATGNTADRYIQTEIDVEGVSATGAVSTATASGPTSGQGAQAGQYIKVSAGGTLTVGIETSGAASSSFLTTGLSGVEISRIKMAATVEDMKVDRLEVRTVNGDGNLAQIKLLGTGLSTDPTAYIANGIATFTFATGSEITVPAYGSKVLTVVADTTNVGTIVAGKLGVVGFGTANAKGSGSGNIVQEVVTTTVADIYTASVNDGSEALVAGDVVYTTTTSATGSFNPGYYMVTTASTEAGNAGLTDNISMQLNGTDVTFTAGDKISRLSSTPIANTASTTVAKGDVLYIYGATTGANGFYVVDTAITSAGSIRGANAVINGVTIGASALVTKLTNVGALVGNTMQFEEVEPNIAKNASSPSGSTSASSDQIVAVFDVTAQGSRDLSLSQLTIEKGGSNSPAQYVTHFSLYNGSTKLSEVTTTSVSAVQTGTGTYSGTTITLSSSADGDADNTIYGVTTAEANTFAAGDTLTFVNANGGTAATSTAKVTGVTLDGSLNVTAIAVDVAPTLTANAGHYALEIYNNRVHFNGKSSVGLPTQTITAGQTLTLTVKADTTSVKTLVTGGASANLTISIPGTAGPLTVDTGTPNGLIWTYTALNTAGTAHTGSTADNYPVAANTLSY